MKIQILVVLLLATLVGCAAPKSHAHKKIKVLILTGGHGFKADPFFKMFQDNPEIEFTADKQVKAAEGYDRPDLYTYDVVLCYDAPSNMTDGERARFLALFDKGIGVFVLQHAYLAYPTWSEYERIAGGCYVYTKEQEAKGMPSSNYKGNVDIPVTVVAKHPVTEGLHDFVLRDELYTNMHMLDNSTPLLKDGDEWLAWYRTEKNSRVFGTILGHGCYDDPNFRKLVAQGIRWVAKRS